MGFLKTSATIVMFIFISSISCYSQAVEGNDYERSSMHIMMIKHLNQRYDDIIEEVFLKYPFPARFNNHDLGFYVVMKIAEGLRIGSYFEKRVLRKRKRAYDKKGFKSKNMEVVWSSLKGLF